MSDAMQKQNEREAHLRALAERLEFTVEKTGDRFTLTRIADVSSPVRQEPTKTLPLRKLQLLVDLAI